MVILVGGIDLSVGSSALLSAVLTMFLLNHGYLPTPIAIIVGIAAASAVGLDQRLPGGERGHQPYHRDPRHDDCGSGPGADHPLSTMAGLVRDPSSPSSPRRPCCSFPPLSCLMVVLYLVFAVLLADQTSFGRYLYAIGGNPRATALCGVSVVRLKTIAYILSGCTAGIGGLILAARLSAVSPAGGQQHPVRRDPRRRAGGGKPERRGGKAGEVSARSPHRGHDPELPDDQGDSRRLPDRRQRIPDPGSRHHRPVRARGKPHEQSRIAADVRVGSEGVRAHLHGRPAHRRLQRPQSGLPYLRQPREHPGTERGARHRRRRRHLHDHRGTIRPFPGLGGGALRCRARRRHAGHQ